MWTFEFFNFRPRLLEVSMILVMNDIVSWSASRSTSWEVFSYKSYGCFLPLVPSPLENLFYEIDAEGGYRLACFWYMNPFFIVILVPLNWIYIPVDFELKLKLNSLEPISTKTIPFSKQNFGILHSWNSAQSNAASVFLVHKICPIC